MPSNSTSKMFHAFGVSLGVDELNRQQNKIRKDLPSLIPPPPKHEMKHGLTYALSCSADKNNTPMD